MTNRQGGHRKALGVDIGGSSTKFCLIDGEKRTILKTKTISHEHETNIDSVCSKIFNQIKMWEFEGSIGIGFPGIVDEMVIVDAPNLGDEWKNFDFKAHFSQPNIQIVSVLNDADAAAVAMIEQTTQWPEKNILCLTVGTGIGSGWISEGELLKGTEYGRQFSPKLQRTLEQWASAKVIKQEKISLGEWVIRFSDVLHILVERYSPEAIVLSGGITSDNERWLPELQALNPIRIEISNHAEHTGAYGAALHSLV